MHGRCSVALLASGCSQHGPDGIVAGILVGNPVQQIAKRNGQHALRHAGEDGLRQACTRSRHLSAPSWDCKFRGGCHAS